ncbi:hypothetical protein AAG570_008064 [Ranatra chinensis]|uniref:Uncharacterized protein n=1 Tax=Ranatra chinensis TaxID=642074 RepID=A0ABD0XTM9_9HEMI
MNDDLYDGEEIKNLGDKDSKGVNDEVEKCIDDEGGEICEEYIDEESEDDRVICEEKDSNNKIEDDQEYSVEEWYEGERDDEWEKDRDEEEMDNGREKECGEFKCYRIGGSMNLKDDNQLLLNYEETDDNRNTWRDPNEVTTSESEESSGSSISSSDSGYGLANNEETDNMIDNRINREVNHEIDRDMNYGINFDSDESYYSHNWDEEELEMLAYEILVSALGEFIEWDTESESEDECG